MSLVHNDFLMTKLKYKNLQRDQRGLQNIKMLTQQVPNFCRITDHL